MSPVLNQPDLSLIGKDESEYRELCNFQLVLRPSICVAQFLVKQAGLSSF